MKSHLRKEMKGVLNLISEEQHEAHSTSIANALYETCLWKEARVIAATVSRNKEVNTKAIIERAWKDGKKVAVPKCNPQHLKWFSTRLRIFHSLKQCTTG